MVREGCQLDHSFPLSARGCIAAKRVNWDLILVFVIESSYRELIDLLMNGRIRLLLFDLFAF